MMAEFRSCESLPHCPAPSYHEFRCIAVNTVPEASFDPLWVNLPYGGAPAPSISRFMPPMTKFRCSVIM